MSDKIYDDLLNNLRMLDGVEAGDYVSINSDGNIYCRWSTNWWNTITSAVRLETWNQTYECLTKVYCKLMPDYIEILKDREDGEERMTDLRERAKRAIHGLKHLKNVYSYAYQTKSGGAYDQQFDTLIDSYALLQIKYMKKILKQKKKVREALGQSSDSDSDEKKET